MPVSLSAKTALSLATELALRFSQASDSPRLDAQVLLAHILGRSRAWLLAHPEAVLTEEQISTLELAAWKVNQGEPLPYVLGCWEFYGRKFQLNPAVLIPRPETELLVETALTWLKQLFSLRSVDRLHAIDVGSGSGCIAISLAASLPGLQVTACDRSWPALQLVRHNACLNGVDQRIHCLQSDLISAVVPAGLDLICANLPYIPTAVLHSLPIYGREPEIALDGGPDGLTLIRRLLAQASACLAANGLLLLEIEASQGEIVPALAKEVFPFAAIELQQDLAGKDRLVTVYTSGALS